MGTHVYCEAGSCIYFWRDSLNSCWSGIGWVIVLDARILTSGLNLELDFDLGNDRAAWIWMDGGNRLRLVNVTKMIVWTQQIGWTFIISSQVEFNNK